MLDYILCKEFGWTITELDEQPLDRVIKFVRIMQIQRQQEKMKEQAAQNG